MVLDLFAACNCYDANSDDWNTDFDRRQGRKNGASRTGKIIVNRINEDEVKRNREVALHNMPGYDNIPNDLHHRFQNEGRQPQHTMAPQTVERSSPKVNQHHIPTFQGSTSAAPEAEKFGFQHSLGNRWQQNDAQPNVSLNSFDTLPDEFKAPSNSVSPVGNPYASPEHKLQKQTTDVWMGKSLGNIQSGVHQPEILPLRRHSNEPAQGEDETTPIPDGSPTSLGFF